MISKHLAKGSECPPIQTESLRIYSTRVCPYGQRVLLVAESRKIPYDIVYVSLKDKPDWLLRLNPTGLVPVIETAQGPLCESLVINEFLDEFHAGNKLAAADPYQKAIDKIWSERSSKLLLAIIKGIGDDAAMTENRFKQLADALNPLEGELKRRGTPYFGGAQPGLLDYNIWPAFERIPVLKIAFPRYDFETAKSQNPILEKWRKAMKEDRAVKVSYLAPDLHHDFLMTDFAGTPDYSLLE